MRKRYTVLDVLRGFSIVCMVIYHILWDLVNVYNMDIAFFNSESGAAFQRFIRWSFILISGFSWSLGHSRLKRALIVSGSSVLISVVTSVFTPDIAIRYGVLSLIGTGMLITIPLDRLFRKISPFIALPILSLLFALTYYAELGQFGIGDFTIFTFPDCLYANNFTAYLGFPALSFTSPDYVPVVPWLFLFWIGYFLYRLFEKFDWLKILSSFSFKPLEFLGRHSLIIYLAHQPLIYGVLYVIFELILKK